MTSIRMGFVILGFARYAAFTVLPDHIVSANISSAARAREASSFTSRFKLEAKYLANLDQIVMIYIRIVRNRSGSIFWKPTAL